MARPVKEGLDYFPMDVILDDKVRAVESIFKNDGFTWIVKFWQAAYKTNDGCVDFEGFYGVIHADNSRVTQEKQKEIIDFCLDISLIYKTDDGKYTSSGIQKRMKHIIEWRERWRNKNKNKFSPEITTEGTTEETPEIKLKGNRNIKETLKSKSAFAPPSLSDVVEYCKERKNAVDSEKWMAHYQSNGWRVGRNPMKDWKAAVRTWERNDGATATSAAPSQQDAFPHY